MIPTVQIHVGLESKVKKKWGGGSGRGRKTEMERKRLKYLSYTGHVHTYSGVDTCWVVSTGVQHNHRSLRNFLKYRHKHMKMLVTNTHSYTQRISENVLIAILIVQFTKELRKDTY